MHRPCTRHLMHTRAWAWGRGGAPPPTCHTYLVRATGQGMARGGAPATLPAHHPAPGAGVTSQLLCCTTVVGYQRRGMVCGAGVPSIHWVQVWGAGWCAPRARGTRWVWCAGWVACARVCPGIRGCGPAPGWPGAMRGWLVFLVAWVPELSARGVVTTGGRCALPRGWGVLAGPVVLPRLASSCSRSGLRWRWLGRAAHHRGRGTRCARGRRTTLFGVGRCSR